MKQRRRFALILMALVSQAGLAAEVLVDTAWLGSRLNEPDVIVVDMTDDEMQYTRYHIPGAVRLAYSDLLSEPVGKAPPSPLTEAQLAKLLGALGISRQSRVVIYDDVGGLNAGRLFFDLERIGHPQVSVLNGGSVQWVLEGRRVDNKPAVRMPVVYRLGEPGRANLVQRSEVRQASDKTVPAILLDVRTKEEYAGNPKEARSGHVPNAHWWPWEQAVRMDRGFLLEEPEALAASLAKVGVTDKNAPVILYCRSGHRASQSYLTLRHLGYENVRLYAGSMNDYARDPLAPLVRGLRP